jgi:hypothetical protein
MSKKYIYTIWTKPWIVGNHKRYFYDNILYLLFSIELLKKQNANIKIYTDDYGKNFLKNLNIDIELDTNIVNNFENLDVKKWSIPKLYVIKNQSEEVCHIDHDVFLWEPQKNLTHYDIVTQNFENSEFYFGFYKELHTHYINNAENVSKELKEFNYFAGYNCGYIDIFNVSIAKKWVDFGIDLSNNLKKFRWKDCSFIEQFSLYFLSKKNNNFKIGYLFDAFNNASYHPETERKYTHLMGQKDFFSDTTLIVTNALKKINFNLYKKLIDLKSVN